MTGYSILRNPLRIDPQAYLCESFRGFRLANYGVKRADIDLWAARVFGQYDPEGGGRVAYKSLYPMIHEFLRVNGRGSLREMDLLWLAREFDDNGRGEASLADFEMMLECLGGRPVEKWMIEQYRQNAGVYGARWREMFREY